MIVKCKSLMTHAGLHVERSDLLTHDKEYVVLGISITPGKAIEYRLACDDGTLALQRAEQFQVIDASTPASWSAVPAAGGHVGIGYPDLLRAGVLERYFDGEPDAADVVQKVVDQASTDSGISSAVPSTYGSLG